MSSSSFDLTKARREFRFMIERCGCSRASTYITEEEAEAMSQGGWRMSPTEPYCTPKLCFPTLYALLYPKGGFNVVCNDVKQFRRGEANRDE